MTEIPQVEAGSLTVAIDEQIAKLKAMQLPSLRVVHNARRQTVKLNYDRDRDQQLTIRTSNLRDAHPGHRDIAESWIGMLQAVVKPAELLKLKADVVPSKKGVLTESAAYFAATILAVSTWPINVPYPPGVDLFAVLTVRLGKEDGETVGHVSVEFWATSATSKIPEPFEKSAPTMVQDRGYYWQRCCEKMTPWLEDSGIRELSILVPMCPAGEPQSFGDRHGNTTVH